MTVLINLIVLALSAAGSVAMTHSDCLLRDCMDGSGLPAIARLGLPILMLYSVLTVGVVYRVALVLRHKWGLVLAALLPAANVAITVSLCFFDSRSQGSRHIVTLALDLGVPWFIASLGGLLLNRRFIPARQPAGHTAAP